MHSVHMHFVCLRPMVGLFMLPSFPYKKLRQVIRLPYGMLPSFEPVGESVEGIGYPRAAVEEQKEHDCVSLCEGVRIRSGRKTSRDHKPRETGYRLEGRKIRDDLDAEPDHSNDGEEEGKTKSKAKTVLIVRHEKPFSSRPN